MQNRRVYALDQKGVNEWLNERDESGHGIRVKATYYVELLDESKARSKQRLVQHKVNDPIQTSYAFDLSKTSNMTSNKLS